MKNFEVYNLPKGSSGFSWFFEQQTYFPKGLIRAIKSSEGSGNIPKVIIEVKNEKILQCSNAR